MLVIDVGTNAEIVLGNRERLLSASQPDRPGLRGRADRPRPARRARRDRARADRPAHRRAALQGDRQGAWIEACRRRRISRRGPTGICGSGIIEAVAELYLAGLMDAGRPLRRGRAVRAPRASALMAGPPNTYWPTPAKRHRAPNRRHPERCPRDPAGQGGAVCGGEAPDDGGSISAVDRVLLAGAFGTISPLHAMALGMIPDCAWRK